jgi:hypothetical protein
MQRSSLLIDCITRISFGSRITVRRGETVPRHGILRIWGSNKNRFALVLTSGETFNVSAGVPWGGGGPRQELNSPRPEAAEHPCPSGWIVGVGDFGLSLDLEEQGQRQTPLNEAVGPRDYIAPSWRAAEAKTRSHPVIATRSGNFSTTSLCSGLSRGSAIGNPGTTFCATVQTRRSTFYMICSTAH